MFIWKKWVNLSECVLWNPPKTCTFCRGTAGTYGAQGGDSFLLPTSVWLHFSMCVSNSYILSKMGLLNKVRVFLVDRLREKSM